MSDIWRWMMWRRCVASWMLYLRHDRLGGLVVEYDAPPDYETKVDRQCHKHGFDSAMALAAAQASINGHYGDWRRSQGLARFSAP